MKQLAAFLALLCTASVAVADDYGRVVSTTPIIRDVPQSRQVCHDETVSMPAQRSGSGVGALIGGVAGGLLGHTVGRGSGNTVATAAGAFTGAIVGDRLGSDDNPGSTQQQRRCQTVQEHQDQVVGYRVVYEYAGRQYKTRVAQDPGQWIPVSVQANVPAQVDNNYRETVSSNTQTIVETAPVAVYAPEAYYPPVISEPTASFRYDVYPRRHYYRRWE